MANTLKEMTLDQFINYLIRVGVDQLESGHEATSDDYAEAARRLMEFQRPVT